MCVRAYVYVCVCSVKAAWMFQKVCVIGCAHLTVLVLGTRFAHKQLFKGLLLGARPFSSCLLAVLFVNIQNNCDIVHFKNIKLS